MASGDAQTYLDVIKLMVSDIAAGDNRCMDEIGTTLYMLFYYSSQLRKPVECYCCIIPFFTPVVKMKNTISDQASTSKKLNDLLQMWRAEAVPGVVTN